MSPVRSARVEDFELLDAIENEADRLLIEVLRPDRWDAAASGPARADIPGFVLVAEADPGRVVGFVQVIETEGIAHLEQLSVLPELGRRGYGRSLVEEAKREARRRGHRRLTLRTYAEIPWNAPFYASAGFVEEEASTPFHRALIRTEAELGLDRCGRRIQMAVGLDTTPAFETSSLFHREFGDASAPPLFLIHGLYGDSTTVEPLAESLAARFRVVAPDMLGHGRSSRPPTFSLQDQGRALNGLIASLGYESAAVVGISMGSYVAAQAAILEPARTSALVLVVSKAHGTTSSSAAYAARQGIDLSTVSPERMVELMAGALWSPATSQSRRDEIMATVPPDQIVLDAEERTAVERSLANFDLRPGLPSITAPTLVISGRADGLNPPEAGEEVAALIPGASFAIYEESGHMLATEEEDRLVTDISAHVLGTEQRS